MWKIKLCFLITLIGCVLSSISSGFHFVFVQKLFYLRSNFVKLERRPWGDGISRKRERGWRENISKIRSVKLFPNKFEDNNEKTTTLGLNNDNYKQIYSNGEQVVWSSKTNSKIVNIQFSSLSDYRFTFKNFQGREAWVTLLAMY